MNDAQIQAQAYSYFLAEAPELLQTIEQEILTLPSEHTTAKVHNLMRALHTLKGAAANVGLSAIERIAHDFEDVTRVFYDLDVEIDIEVQTLLLDGYTGLQECLLAQTTAGRSDSADRDLDEQEIVARMEIVIDNLKSKLGDWSEADIALPSSIELGFDIVVSIFETTIQEQIDELIAVVATDDAALIAECLRRVADIGSSLAES
ncbi:Hpt domain-containing protein, partial [Chamaesiphon sp. OTE_75_metabat_556]|uniref:Hpt domain-containing protein n=1 Tax=Chamaesiphon sp. OTE_75_metabat_556 TaxID=2964692 RepID=UPI00286B6809